MRERERENKHTNEEELRQKVGQETLASGSLMWHSCSARRTEKQGTRLGTRLVS